MLSSSPCHLFVPWWEVWDCPSTLLRHLSHVFVNDILKRRRWVVDGGNGGGWGALLEITNRNFIISLLLKIINLLAIQAKARFCASLRGSYSIIIWYNLPICTGCKLLKAGGNHLRLITEGFAASMNLPFGTFTYRMFIDLTLTQGWTRTFGSPNIFHRGKAWHIGIRLKQAVSRNCTKIFGKCTLFTVETLTCCPLMLLNL